MSGNDDIYRIYLTGSFCFFPQPQEKLSFDKSEREKQESKGTYDWELRDLTDQPVH